jgi:ferredoxin
MPYAIQKNCTKCGACLKECPTGSIIEGNRQFHIDTDTCSDHAACVAVCPVDAIVTVAARPKEGSEPEEEEL